ncbi:hypothetical protein PIB30_107624 [Stylosanthes scabra]|uniref:Transposase (putative) gypsy type domain-containing protein n=1 Tax=Stylosanthes scabra TaxID=79078 RepID=A0ABU6R1S9_9FABA|nr:hypothetical protein [Stylosanthes scabra]
MVGESEVSIGGLYGWVKEGVLEIPSLFLDAESVEQLGSALLWVRSGQEIKMEFVPCSPHDRVCYEGKDADWFFMYTCVFAEIGIRFPFTKFECAVLRQLNCAPSQMHPNSWAFIQAFEVLMEYLQEEPSLGLLPIGISRSSIPFFLDENLSEKFPLYWKRNPVQCLGVEELSERDAGLCEFLFENLKGGKILTTSELLKWYINRGAVVKGRKGRCCGKDVELETVVEFSRSQQGLHGFDESDSLSSLWFKRYPFSAVADEHFQPKANVEMQKRTGKVAAAKYVQVQAARLMCISHGLELQALEEESSQKNKRADMLELEKKLRFTTEQVGLRERENGLLKEENDGLRVTIAKLSKDKKDLEGRVVEVCGERC